MELRVTGFLLLYDPFDPNRSRLGPFGQNGSRFCGWPDKAPRADGWVVVVGGKNGLASPTKGSAGLR